MPVYFSARCITKDFIKTMAGKKEFGFAYRNSTARFDFLLDLAHGTHFPKKRRPEAL
jgi:hypothetical protein